jgi:putative CocE/NonD family hydrolase
LISDISEDDYMVVSEPVYECQVEKHTPVPMRDGVILRADVYRPKAEDKFPVLIERTQGWRGDGGTHNCPATGNFFAPKGYAYVAQDVRGAFDSEGQFIFGHHDGWGINRDGYDTIEWAAKQPWSNGNIATLGGCSTGMTAIQAAPTRHPHLKTISINIPGAEKNYYYRNNVCRLSLYRGMAFWFRLLQLRHETAPPGMEAIRARLQAAFENPEEIDSWFHHLPLKSFPPADGWGEWYFNVLDHPEDGPYWWRNDVSTRLGEISIPILHLTGWFDFALGHNLDHFAGIQMNGRSEECRRGQRLIVGPWGHLNLGQQKIGELDFGHEASVDIGAIQLAWFDYWLKGIQNETMGGQPVKLFLMGENRWIEMETWPPPTVDYRPLYLREGNAKNNDSLNNRRLTFGKSSISEKPDSFTYDPNDPTPSLASDIDALPMDYRALEERMLTYTSEALEQSVRVVGPVKATLYGLSSVPDTDWVVRLCDVWPDGRSMPVCDGILRARYRNSFEKQELMIPNKVYQFDVDIWATAQTFLPGHRIRVQVTSSDFPRYDRNLNTGGPFGEEIQGKIAVNTIFHDELRPSQIILPIMS